MSVDPRDLFTYRFDEIVYSLDGCLRLCLLLGPGNPPLTENRVESAAKSGEMPVDGSASVGLVGLILSGITLFLYAGAVYASEQFSRASGVWGLIAAGFMMIPSTAGTVGMFFALGSLVPWVVFAALVGRHLTRLVP